MPRPRWTDPTDRQTDRQHGLYSTLCRLKKKHTAQERESPQEKAHVDASEESTEEERIKPKQDFKTKTGQTKETAFFSGQKKQQT